MISGTEQDDEDTDAPDLQRLQEADLLAMADAPREHPGAKDAVLQELRRRGSPAYRDLLLALCVDPDVDPGFRLHLIHTATKGDRATSNAVWWLILHTEGGGFEYEEHHQQAVDLTSSADRDQSGDCDRVERTRGRSLTSPSTPRWYETKRASSPSVRL